MADEVQKFPFPTQKSLSDGAQHYLNVKMQIPNLVVHLDEIIFPQKTINSG